MKSRNVLSTIVFILLCSYVSFTQPKKLADIEGIVPAYQKKLEVAGIKTPAQLYDAASPRKGREELAQKSGISVTLLLKWVNRYDLACVKGIGIPRMRRR